MNGKQRKSTTIILPLKKQSLKVIVFPRSVREWIKKSGYRNKKIIIKEK